MSDFPVLLRTQGERGWRSFSNPTHVFVARTSEDVVSCLEDVQRAVRQSGCWAAGFVVYEAAGAFGLPVAVAARPSSLPLVWLGIFPPDHVTLRERLDPGSGYSAGRWQPSIDKARYLTAVHAIKARIAAGDTYQINYTFRLTAPFSGDPISLLGDLDAAQKGPWGGLVDIGTHAICSASPELFYRLDGDRIECRPMKGTAPRGRSADEDLRRARALQRSEKNRAENVMVVDMTRNDLGRIARTGSVVVPSMFDVERYPGQWQMTSTVAADTAADVARLFEALFPSGSVTGAPKRSSMAIIRDLETGPRGVYTGAIGCLSPDGRAHFNVAIRTVVIDRERGHAEFGVGSGVVWDSVDSDEYDECLNKTAMLARRQEQFRLLETLRWSLSEGFVRLDLHLERMRASADYFGFEHPDEHQLEAGLASAVRNHDRAVRVRMLADRDGSVRVEALPLNPTPDPMRVALAAEPVSSSNVFLFHKTTRREVYERARAARPDLDAVLLWNEREEITEATEANLIVEIDGRRVTPPIECGVLPGVLRAELLQVDEIEEGIVRRGDLPRANRIWLISSLRGWMRARLVK